MIFCYIRLVSWYKNFCTNFVPECDNKDEKIQKNTRIKTREKLDFMRATNLYERGGVLLKRHHISNKIPYPKERVYPDTLFYYLEFMRVPRLFTFFIPFLM